MNRYPCHNCMSSGKYGCLRGTDSCQLVVLIAEQIAEPGKIEKFVDVLKYLNMTVKVSGDAFRIVSL